MAEVKDNIIDLNRVYKEFNTTINENINALQKGATAVEKYNKVISIKPSDYSKGIDDINAKTKQLEQSQKNLEATEKKLQQTRLQEIKLQKQREKAFDDFDKKIQATNKQIEREQQLLEKSNSIYSKVQQRVNSLTKTYNDIAMKRELGMKLNKDEEGQLLSLEKRLQKYQTALYNVDSNIGKHQRNVGNYASGFNGLSNSINQITRELPAFTFSAQTGFLALSNNIPILTDEIGRLIDKNKELAKQGQPVKSVFSQILGSLFSLQTAMGIGILLFTLYGKEIGEFISGLFKSSNAVQTLSSQLTSLNDARLKATETASKEISELDKLYKISTNVSYSINERKQAVDKLQELYPNYLSNITDENILNGKAEKQYYLLRDAILAKYTAQAISDKLAENSRDRLDDYMELQQNLINAEKNVGIELNKNNGYRKKYIETDINGKVLSIKKDYEQESALRLLRGAIGRRNNAEKELNNFKKQSLKDDDLLIKTQQDLIKQSSLLNTNKKKETKTIIENKKTQSESNNITKEKVQLLKNELTDLQKLEKAYQDYQKAQNSIILAPDRNINVGANNEMYDVMLSQRIKNLDKEIESEKNNYQEKERLFQLRKQLILEELNLQMVSEFTGDEFKDNAITLKYENLRNEINKTKTPLEELSELAKETANSMVDNFASNTGFTTTFQILNKQIEGFGENWLITTDAILSASTEMFNFLNSMSQENFDAEYERENRRKENALMFAGDSAVAKAEIEKESERRTREIKKREAQAQKKQAIFQASIDMVKGIMGALAMTPPNVPLSVFIGALGLSNIARLNSQQIPEFWKGTDNAPAGVAWTNERGREIITDAKGKIKDFGTEKGATLKYLNKGDKVLKHSDTMQQLNNIYAQNSILPPVSNNVNIDFLPLQKDIKNLTNVIANKTEYTIVKDANGYNIYKKENGRREQIKNSVLNSQKRYV